MKKIIVIPTYNERENIKKLIPAISFFDKGAHILVVDDNSPDGTAKEVKKIMKLRKNVRLLERPAKLGLGTAYTDGFKLAVADKYDLIFEMDADFSHDPKYLPELTEVSKKYDLTIGSRYINGVSVINWPLRRLMLSKFANLYARAITGLPLTDLTSGFKCYKRKVLEEIGLDAVHSDGYAFQIEMHYKVWKKGFSIKEVPVIFVDRLKGSSKMSKGVIAEAVLMPWKLKFTL